MAGEAHGEEPEEELNGLDARGDAAEGDAQSEDEHEGLEEDEHEGLEEEEHEGLEEEEDEEADYSTVVTIEISGLSLFTHLGVTAAEREVGQRLVVDLRLDVGESDATITDQIEDTVDYAEVCQLVALVSQQRSYRTLERLCSAIADRLLADFDIEAVWVKSSKPEPPIPLPVEEVSVEVWRESAE